MRLIDKIRYKLLLVLSVLVIFLGILYIQDFSALQQSTIQRLKSLLKECHNDPVCFKRKLILSKEKINLAEVMNVLEEAVGANACHELAHAIGEVVGESNQDISQHIASCNEKCGFGCYHGVLLGNLRVNPNLINDLDYVCSPLAKLSYPGQQLTACNHGLGHGLGEYAKFDLVESTKLCDRLTNIRSQDECVTGVFMEIIEGSIQGNNRAQLKIPENIADVCQPLTGSPKDTCLINTGSYEYKRSKNTKKSFQLCRDLPVNIKDHCIEDLGTDFHFILGGDAKKILNECQEGSSEEELLCIRGAIFSSFVTDPTGTTGIALCRKATSGIQKECFSYLGTNIQGIKGQAARSAFCSQLASLEKKYCLGDSE